MATANTTLKKPCSKCDKGGGILGGIFTCDGCHQSFCRKHSEEHRQELAIQMDSVGQEHDILQRDINREADVQPLLSRIDVWERESINKIQQVANQARADLNQLINQKKQELKTTVGRLINELQSSRESEDYTELDLKKWIDQLNELRQDLEQSINAYLLDEDNQRLVIRLIKVKNPQQLRSFTQPIGASGQNSNINQNSMSVNSERFGKGDDQIKLSENNLVAMDSGARSASPSFVFGVNQYSIGRHHIPFQIENKVNNNFFIGIVTFSQTDSSSVFSSTSTVNGWWLCLYAIVCGVRRTFSTITEMMEGDELTLTIDCDKKQIYINHDRTKEKLQLSVDIQKCPFPWKLVVGLGRTGNGIRIIH
jgi:BMFP domain-containing protein YqiC